MTENERQIKARDSGAPSAPSETLLLAITDLTHMFNAPAVDPLSRGLPEILGVSGVEYLLDQLRHDNTKTLQLILPEREILPRIAEHIQQALRRFAESRIQQQETLMRETRRRGWKITVAALVVLAIFLSLSSLFGSEMAQGIPSLLRKTLEYGFEIIGWVMLWRPIEILVFEPIALKDNIAALKKLAKLRVLIRKSA
jgi:hypothetical protein